MEKITIVPLSQKEVTQAEQIEKNNLPEAWSARQISSLLESGGVYLCAKENNNLVGIGSLYVVAGEGQIMNIAVEPHMRNKGIGKKILLALIQEGIQRGAKSFVIEVNEQNTIAISLYKSLGFVVLGTRNAARGSGKACIMELSDINMPD